MKEALNIVPTLLGADFNAYSVAMAFHSAFGVKSHAFGRYKCGLSDFSRIVKIEFCSGYESNSVFLPELISFAEKNKGKKLVLIPCADCYVEFINENRDELSKYYSFLVPKDELVKRLTDKAAFYRELSRCGIDFPEFIELKEGDNYQKKLGRLSYPAVLKPAVSAEYWRHPFPSMRKVYYPSDKDEAARIVSELRCYGYKDGIVLQRLVPKCEIYVYTALYDKGGKRDFGVLGRVVLEEIGKTSAGNHSAIITEEGAVITDKLDKMLEELGYTGFANFDILKSEGKYYVLELNARQGRSCDYIRCAGINIGERLLSLLGIKESVKKNDYERIFWHYPPLSSALKYMTEYDKAEALLLKKKGRAWSALCYSPDLWLNPLRQGYVLLHGRRVSKRLASDFEEKAR